MKNSVLCKDRTHDLQYTSNRETYALSIAPTKHRLGQGVINIYLNIFQLFFVFLFFCFFFAHKSTKPKNYISLLIRVPRCFFPKENTRQTLRHILALTIYIYIYIYIYLSIYIYIYIGSLEVDFRVEQCSIR